MTLEQLFEAFIAANYSMLHMSQVAYLCGTSKKTDYWHCSFQHETKRNPEGGLLQAKGAGRSALQCVSNAYAKLKPAPIDLSELD